MLEELRTSRAGHFAALLKDSVIKAYGSGGSSDLERAKSLIKRIASFLGSQALPMPEIQEMTSLLESLLTFTLQDPAHFSLFPYLRYLLRKNFYQLS